MTIDSDPEVLFDPPSCVECGKVLLGEEAEDYRKLCIPCQDATSFGESL